MTRLSALCFIPLVAFGTLGLSLPLSAHAQGLGGYYGAQVEYDDIDEAPLPPRPVPGYTARPGVVEATTVTTTRRIVVPRDRDWDDEPDTVVTTRRVIAPPPVRRPPPDEVVITGSVRTAPIAPHQRVYKSEPTYVPVARRAWRHEIEVAPRVAEPRPVIIEERRVETTRRILAPAPLD